MKRFVHIAALCLAVILVASSALADITFDANGNVSFGGSSVSLQAITNTIAQAIDVTEGDVTWTVTEEATGASASMVLAIGTEAGEIGTADTKAIATAVIGDKDVVVKLADAETGVAGNVIITLQLSDGVVAMLCEGPAAVSDSTLAPAPTCKPGKHNLAWVDAKYATCTKKGWRQLKCKKCGIETTETLPALGHKGYTVKGYPATCTAPGLTKGVVCTRCKLVMEPQQKIKAKGHKDTDGDGKCDVCGAVIGGAK